MAGVQTLLFQGNCVLEGARFINKGTQMRHIWGYGGILEFNETGKLIYHCPGSHLMAAHYPNVNGYNANRGEVLEMSCYTQTPAWDLILIDGQISYPQIIKFLSTGQVVELLEEELGIIDYYGVVIEGKKDEFIKFLDALHAILNGEYDRDKPYHDIIVGYRALGNLLQPDIQAAFQANKEKVIRIEDEGYCNLPINGDEYGICLTDLGESDV